MSSRARRATLQPASFSPPKVISVISPLKRPGSASSSLSAFPLFATSLTSKPASTRLSFRSRRTTPSSSISKSVLSGIIGSPPSIRDPQRELYCEAPHFLRVRSMRLSSGRNRTGLGAVLAKDRLVQSGLVSNLLRRGFRSDKYLDGGIWQSGLLGSSDA